MTTAASNALGKESFTSYLRERWVPEGFQVSEVGEAPYKDKQKNLTDGFSIGMSVARGDAGPGNKARVGVWFRPAPRGGINDLAALRTHYQSTLQSQGRGCRIHNCATEFGSVFLFWETTAPLAPELYSGWAGMVEQLTAACFDSDALDEYLDQFR
jgi:hypothetical protein